MKNAFIICLLMVGSISGFSQNSQDSLSVLMQNFQYPKALIYIDRQKPTKELLSQKALCYKALGEYIKAIDILATLSLDYPTDVQILSELAICYQAIAQRQASIDCYDRLIEIDTANIYFKIQKAEQQFQQGKYEKALKLFYTIYDQGKSTNTLKQIAQCYEMMNEVDSAITYYRKTLAENPLDGYSAASLTNICLKEGLLPEGKSCSQAFMDMDTTNLQVNLLNALCYYATEQGYDEAIDRFKKCEQRGDTTLILNRSLGTSYFMIKRYYDAELYLDRAFRQDTTNNTVLFALASSAMELGDHKKSTPLFEKLLSRVKPDSTLLSLSYTKLAASYQKASRNKDAVETYIRSLDYQKPNVKMGTYYTIANIYDDKLDDIKNAITYYTYYRGALDEYIGSLKKNTEDELIKNRIEDTEEKIKALDEHILDLKKGRTEGQKSFAKKQNENFRISLKQTNGTPSDTIRKKEAKSYIIRKNESGTLRIQN